MKNRAVNQLEYTGIVTLSQYIDGNKKIIKRIKNSGGSSLYDFFSACLVGDFTTAAKIRPVKIIFLNNTVEDKKTIYTPASEGFIYQTTDPERISGQTGSDTSICYSFTVPIGYTKLVFNHIGLYPSAADTTTLDKYSAICEFSLKDATISASSVLVIDWVLKIANPAAPATTVS
jgi:hypothetical protein